MVTSNETIYGSWIEILNMKNLSNCGRNGEVEFWTGTVPPIKDNIGHFISYGNGVDDGVLDINDRFFIRASNGYAVVCITRKV